MSMARRSIRYVHIEWHVSGKGPGCGLGHQYGKIEFHPFFFLNLLAPPDFVVLYLLSSSPWAGSGPSQSQTLLPQHRIA